MAWLYEPPPRLVSMPFAAADSVTVTVSVWPTFASAISAPANGVTVPRSVIAWLAVLAVIVGGTAAKVAVTEVEALVAVCAAVSVTLMLKLVVTLVFGATVGVNTRPFSAAVTTLAEPVMV